MANAIFSPKNDFFRLFLLEDIDESNAQIVPVTTGATVVGFISKTHTATSTAAHSSLNAELTHVGVAEPGPKEYPLGTWLVAIQAADPAPCDAALGPDGSLCYLIVESDTGVRRWEQLTYQNSQKATIAK